MGAGIFHHGRAVDEGAIFLTWLVGPGAVFVVPTALHILGTLGRDDEPGPPALLILLLVIFWAIVGVGAALGIMVHRLPARHGWTFQCVLAFWCALLMALLMLPIGRNYVLLQFYFWLLLALALATPCIWLWRVVRRRLPGAAPR